jgi:hypothetical protein
VNIENKGKKKEKITFILNFLLQKSYSSPLVIKIFIFDEYTCINQTQNSFQPYIRAKESTDYNYHQIFKVTSIFLTFDP